MVLITGGVTHTHTHPFANSFGLVSRLIRMKATKKKKKREAGLAGRFYVGLCCFFVCCTFVLPDDPTGRITVSFHIILR